MGDPAAGRIDALRRKLQEEPESKLFLQLAEAYRQAGEFEEAVETCRKGLEKHPCYHSARVSLGRLYLETGRPDEAKRELETVLQDVPDNLLASRLLEQIRNEPAEPASPPAAVVAGGGTPPVPDTDPKPVTPGGGTAAAGVPESRERRPADRTMPRKEQEPFETETLAEIYLEQGHRDRAVRIFERILKSEPENARIRERLMQLREHGPDPATAGTGGGETETIQRKIAVLRGWLDRIKKG
jgi:tetratricopeptide (TPR) repeat protein